MKSPRVTLANTLTEYDFLSPRQDSQPPSSRPMDILAYVSFKLNHSIHLATYLRAWHCWFPGNARAVRNNVQVGRPLSLRRPWTSLTTVGGTGARYLSKHSF